MERVRGPISAFFTPSSGARFDLTEGHAPITLVGGALQGSTFSQPVASAQVKTAMLFAGMQATGVTSFTEAVRTRDHTEHALRAFGVDSSMTIMNGLGYFRPGSF